MLKPRRPILRTIGVFKSSTIACCVRNRKACSCLKKEMKQAIHSHRYVDPLMLVDMVMSWENFHGLNERIVQFIDGVITIIV